MTPQDKAIAQLLQVSLFKLGDEYHRTIASLKRAAPERTEELDKVALGVEQMIDDVLADFLENGAEFDMSAVDVIHEQIVNVKRVRDI